MKIISDHGFPKGDGSIPGDDPFDLFKNERDYRASTRGNKTTVAAMDWAAAEIERLRAALTPSQQSGAGEVEPVAWRPTDEQVQSACLSYRHDFGLLTVADAAIVKSEAREWLRAWQKEGAGVDRNEIIEQCARVVDQANCEGPYQAIAAASRIRALATPLPTTDTAEGKK
jgi:hypothetical protein